MNLSPQFVGRVKDEEGFVAESFWDDAPGGGNGQWTWGFGTRAPGGPGLRTTRQAATLELIAEIEEAERDYRAVFQTDPPGLTQARYDSLVDMIFNLGLTRFSEFHYTIAAIRAGDWLKGAAHAQQSLWYRQIGNRAKRIVQEFRTGYSAQAEPPKPIASSVPQPVVITPPKSTWLDDLFARIFMSFGKLFGR